MEAVRRSAHGPTERQRRGREIAQGNRRRGGNWKRRGYCITTESNHYRDLSSWISFTEESHNYRNTHSTVSHLYRISIPTVYLPIFYSVAVFIFLVATVSYDYCNLPNSIPTLSCPSSLASPSYFPYRYSISFLPYIHLYLSIFSSVATFTLL